MKASLLAVLLSSPTAGGDEAVGGPQGRRSAVGAWVEEVGAEYGGSGRRGCTVPRRTGDPVQRGVGVGAPAAGARR